LSRHFGTSFSYQRTDIRLPAGGFAIDEVYFEEISAQPVSGPIVVRV